MEKISDARKESLVVLLDGVKQVVHTWRPAALETLELLEAEFDIPEIIGDLQNKGYVLQAETIKDYWGELYSVLGIHVAEAREKIEAALVECYQ